MLKIKTCEVCKTSANMVAVTTEHLYAKESMNIAEDLVYENRCRKVGSVFARQLNPAVDTKLADYGEITDAVAAIPRHMVRVKRQRQQSIEAGDLGAARTKPRSYKQPQHERT